jgi:hypothetical protein
MPNSRRTNATSGRRSTSPSLRGPSPAGDGSFRSQPSGAAQCRAPVSKFENSCAVVWAVMAVSLLWCDGALAAEPWVLIVRGWLSGGLDRLADELKARGINAEVRRHLYWTTAVSDILLDRAAGKIGPLILVGHSRGGNDAIEIARALALATWGLRRSPRL